MTIFVLALGFYICLAAVALLESASLAELPLPRAVQLVELHWLPAIPPKPALAIAGPGMPADGVFSINEFRRLVSAKSNAARWFAFSLASAFPGGTTLDSAGSASFVNESVVSGSYFPALELKPAAGRLLAASDDRRAAPRTAVVGFGLARRLFGTPARAVKQTVNLDGHPYQIVGVAPRGFQGLRRGISVSVWTPISAWPDLAPGMAMSGGGDKLGPETHWLAVFGRLRTSVAPQYASAQAALLVRAAAAAGLHLPLAEVPAVTVEPGGGGTGVLAALLGPGLFLLLAVAGAGVLLACASTGVMAWARATARRQETAIRRTLGAHASRLIAQAAVESLVTASVAAGIAVAAAYLSLGALAALYAGPLAGLGFTLHFHGIHAPGFALLVAAVLVAAFLGTVPVIRFARPARLANALTRRQPRAGGRMRLSGVRGLIAVQMAISLVIVACALLCARTLYGVNTRNLGYDPSNLLSFTVYPRRQNYSPDAELELLRNVRAHLAAIPGVVSVGATAAPPDSDFAAAGFVWLVGAGHRAQATELITNVVLPGYLRTMRTPISAGRGFSPGAGVAHEAILSRAAVRSLRPGGNLIGREIAISWPPIPQTTYTVVGVAADLVTPVSANFKRGTLYLGYQASRAVAHKARKDGMAIIVRTRGDALGLVPSVRQTLRAAAPQLHITGAPLDCGEPAAAERRLDLRGLYDRHTGVAGVGAGRSQCLGPPGSDLAQPHP